MGTGDLFEEMIFDAIAVNTMNTVQEGARKDHENTANPCNKILKMICHVRAPWFMSQPNILSRKYWLIELGTFFPQLPEEYKVRRL